MFNFWGAAGKARGFRRRAGLGLLILILAATAGCAEDQGPPPIEPVVSTVEWEQSLGGPGPGCAYSVQQTEDKGFIITGQITPAEDGGGELYLAKVDQAGNLEWERNLGGAGRAAGYCARQTADGGYIVAGQIARGGRNEAYLVKTDRRGELEWERFYGDGGGENLLFVDSASNGGYIAAGWTESHNNRRELYLLKVNAQGRKQWASNFCGGSRSTGSYVLETGDGFLAAGWVSGSEEGSGFAGERDIYLVRVDPAGKPVWEQALGGAGDEVGFLVQPEKEGDYVVAGQSFSYASGTTSVYLAGVDPEGRKKWEKNIDSNESYLGLSVHPAREGGFLILGQVMDLDGYRGISLARADREGKKQWVIYLGGGQNSAALSAVQADDDSYVVAGWIEQEGRGNRDVYLVKIKP